MTRPACALLSAHALRHNFERVRHYAPHARIMAVIKADGYGHGLGWAADVLAGADSFAVACAHEGVRLRVAGVRQPVCLLGGLFDDAELAPLGENRLAPVIHCEEQLARLEHSRGLQGLDVWLKVDTGMHRLGFSPEAAASAARRLKACPAVAHLRWLSHLAKADEISDPATTRQIDLFRQTLGGEDAERSLANSAGVVAWPESHFDWVRPGIMLYGGAPLLGGRSADFDLRPVMTLQSRVIAVNRRRRGDTIGYGGDWACPEDMPVGVVAIGYGDGYPRHARPGTPVLIGGERLPIVGRVSMDMITVDLRARPATRVGEAVTLWGEGLAVDEIAGCAGTISYQLLCGVTARVPRVPRDG